MQFGDVIQFYNANPPSSSLLFSHANKLVNESFITEVEISQREFVKWNCEKLNQTRQTNLCKPFYFYFFDYIFFNFFIKFISLFIDINLNIFDTHSLDHLFHQLKLVTQI